MSFRMCTGIGEDKAQGQTVAASCAHACGLNLRTLELEHPLAAIWKY